MITIPPYLCTNAGTNIGLKFGSIRPISHIAKGQIGLGCGRTGGTQGTTPDTSRVGIGFVLTNRIGRIIVILGLFNKSLQFDDGPAIVTRPKGHDKDGGTAIEDTHLADSPRETSKRKKEHNFGRK